MKTKDEVLNEIENVIAKNKKLTKKERLVMETLVKVLREKTKNQSDGEALKLIKSVLLERI